MASRSAQGLRSRVEDNFYNYASSNDRPIQLPYRLSYHDLIEFVFVWGVIWSLQWGARRLRRRPQKALSGVDVGQTPVSTNLALLIAVQFLLVGNVPQVDRS